MNEKIEQRLSELKAEFESGQKMLIDLENQQANLKTTLLRISGAIQILEELINPPDDSDNLVGPENLGQDNHHSDSEREALSSIG